MSEIVLDLTDDEVVSLKVVVARNCAESTSRPMRSLAEKIATIVEPSAREACRVSGHVVRQGMPNCERCRATWAEMQR